MAGRAQRGGRGRSGGGMRGKFGQAKRMIQRDAKQAGRADMVPPAKGRKPPFVRDTDHDGE